MPGGGYGPGGKFIHDRAHRIMEEGDVSERYGAKKGKQVAYAIATQQAHSLDKSPKGFRTESGMSKAKRKYPDKSGYRKTAGVMATAFFDELSKLSSSFGEPQLKPNKLTVGVGKSIKAQSYAKPATVAPQTSQFGAPSPQTPPPPVRS